VIGESDLYAMHLAQLYNLPLNTVAFSKSTVTDKHFIKQSNNLHEFEESKCWSAVCTEKCTNNSNDLYNIFVSIQNNTI